MPFEREFENLYKAIFSGYSLEYQGTEAPL
jgi:hypothetical protein